MNGAEAVPLHQRADITPRDLAEMRRHARELSAALARIQAMAAEEMGRGVCTSRSAVPEIERVAREAISE